MISVPAIPVVPTGSERPVWSVMIPVHNCAALLEHCLAGVVAQLGERDDVEIVVIDDMSSDDPGHVVSRVGGENVRYVRLDEAHGAIGNFNECLRRSRGQYVHVLHGDDGVLDGFYSAMEDALERGADTAVCRTRYMDDSGSALRDTRSERSPSGYWVHALEALAVSNRVRPSGIVTRRQEYEAIGGFRSDLPHAADWEMWARLAAHGRIWFVDEVLSEYRVHDAQDTATRTVTGVNIAERLEAIDHISQHLPAERQLRLRRKAFAYSAVFAARTSIRYTRGRQWNPALAQFRAALTCVQRTLAAEARR
jgi:glycosyltransferase involved in cell wall biosynthesis